jgi:hypothetical protein
MAHPRPWSSAACSNGMASPTAFPVHRALLFATLPLIAVTLAAAQASKPQPLDPSMVAENVGSPFVTSDFAKQLGILVTQQRYPGVIFAPTPPTVVDKGDVWSVTFTVKEWPKNMANLSPALSRRLTLWIRKSDAAIVAIR